MTTTEPRTVTVEQIEAEIASEHYFTAADGICGCAERIAGYVPNEASSAHDTPLRLLTLCVLVLRNGFTVTGQSAYADAAKFNADMGRELAREDAIRQCWKLLGFRLRDQMAAELPQRSRKRYADADIAELRTWRLPMSMTNPLGQKIGVLARMSDNLTFRTEVATRADQDLQAAAALAVLKVANGETPNG